jgi:hypothetical protein
VNQLSQLLVSIQRDAAAMPTGKLRAEIQYHLGVLTISLDDLKKLREGAENAETMTSVTSEVFNAALLVSLYVRELTTRPIDSVMWARPTFN